MILYPIFYCILEIFIILIPDKDEVSCSWMQEFLNMCIELTFKIHFFEYCERFLIICNVKSMLFTPMCLIVTAN